ncbi:MAG: sodium:alanine symporter family protein [Candidatus Methanomethylicota archaeon]|uniref:Sodium:alanine symporter family protein n=1 Tax=Thermoproteota archaeon TaxID=2056631 RepID=A0A497EWR0_9CREN|nr:MAG: sodium:alanine symporter family protein [Candidatus Verstraetearchaeota archaeon]
MGILEAILHWNSVINGIVWGLPMIIMLVATGVLVSILSGFIQIRKFDVAWKTMRWKGGAKGEVKPYKVWAAVMGATVGVGNIAGVSTAIHLGGPGALFWMWVCGILGMCLKATEVTLSVWSRKVLPDGRIRGGTMYYIEKIPKVGPALALLFSLFAFLCAFGIGNMTQANSVAHGAEFIANAFGITDPATIFNVRVASGLLIMFFTALVIIGGLRRIADAAFILVPVMVVWYIVFGLATWVLSGGFFKALQLIFTHAFTPMAGVGGFAGATVFAAVRYGFARGLFSNEAGLGSAPLAYAFAESDHPARQGFYGIFEVFMDTLVVCSITGIAVVATGAYETGATGAYLAMEAFTRVFGAWAGIVMGVALALFAFTTLLTWSFYGETTFIYFMVEKVKILSYRTASWIYRILWLPPIIAAAAAAQHLTAIWDLADTLNGLMAIPNLVAVVYFAPVAMRLLKDFYGRHLAEVTAAGGVSGIGRAFAATKALLKAVKEFYAPSTAVIVNT